LDKGFASHIVGHILLRWVENLVVTTSRGRVNETSCDAGDEETIVDLELDGVHERLALGLEHLVKTLGLCDCARETIENKSES